MVFSRAATNNDSSLIYLSINNDRPFCLLVCRRGQRALTCLDLTLLDKSKTAPSVSFFYSKRVSRLIFQKKTDDISIRINSLNHLVPHVMQRWLSQELLVVSQDLFWKLAVIHMWRELGLLRPVCQASRCVNTKRKTLMSQILSEAWRMIHSQGPHRQ